LKNRSIGAVSLFNPKELQPFVRSIERICLGNGELAGYQPAPRVSFDFILAHRLPKTNYQLSELSVNM